MCIYSKAMIERICKEGNLSSSWDGEQIGERWPVYNKDLKCVATIIQPEREKKEYLIVCEEDERFLDVYTRYPIPPLYASFLPRGLTSPSPAPVATAA
jgi:hypothetical protein